MSTEGTFFLSFVAHTRNSPAPETWAPKYIRPGASNGVWQVPARAAPFRGAGLAVPDGDSAVFTEVSPESPGGGLTVTAPAGFLAEPGEAEEDARRFLARGVTVVESASPPADLAVRLAPLPPDGWVGEADTRPLEPRV